MEKRRKQRIEIKIQRAVSHLEEQYSELLYPLSQMKWEIRDDTTGMYERNLSTDGIKIYYSSEYVENCSVSGLEYRIMHILTHGLLGHFLCKNDYVRKDCRDVIMDVQVLYILDQIGMKTEQIEQKLYRAGHMLSGDFSMGKYYTALVDEAFSNRLLTYTIMGWNYMEMFH